MSWLLLGLVVSAASPSATPSTALQLSFGPWQLAPAEFDVVGVRLGLGLSSNHRVTGFGLTLLDLADENTGWTLALVQLAGRFSGVSMALVNLIVSPLSRSHGSGVLLGLINAAGELDGLAVGAFNELTRNRGVTFGVVNHVDEAVGLNVGVVNVSESVVGVQVGLVNVTEDLLGVQIGLVNVVTNNPAPFFPVINAHF